MKTVSTMKSKRVFAASPLLALSTIVLTGCGTGQASVASNEEIKAATPVPVAIAQPTRADIFATYEATTTIASDADAPVVAKVGGEVVDLFVEEGQRVLQGYVLAQLDGERLRLEMLSAKADLDRVRGEYDRYTDLAARGLVSEAMFEGLKYDLEALAAGYELARLNYDYSKIRAPISGVVSSRDVKLGQTVAINDIVFRITDTSELVAYMQIPQAEIAKFSAGHAATVAVDAIPDTTYIATIARISPTIDVRNGTFRATALIDNRAGELAPGMFARFTISYEKHADALVIPKRALVEEDDRTAVYVVENGEVTRRVIETGIETTDVVEVLDGLSGDEEIVVIGQSGLREGSKVLASNVLQDSYSG
jgi:membrane fusion protein (multidrug efflux system)